MWAESDGSVIGYMCATDWECELGSASGGNVIFPSLDDAKARLRCATGCGIVEVEVRYRALVLKGKEAQA
jgi:hypothetical protein